jgi:predicted Rossmann fold flavoprotein
MAKQLMVIGGGAAGFFCAINAAKESPSLTVSIFEKQSKVLQKVKVSGGGRCNVTHACFKLADLVKKYPRGQSFLKKAFTHFYTQDTIDWFASRGVQLHTEADGRMFPTSNNSQTIIDCLLDEAAKYHVKIQLNTEIISIQKKGPQFILEDKKGKIYSADFLMIASGGFPKPEQYRWLHALRHSIQQPAPSLFTFNMPQHPICQLMGVSVEQVSVKIVGSKLSASGPILITHWGLSGPAILKLSAWGARELQHSNYHFSVLLNWIDTPENTLREDWHAIRIKQSGLALSSKNPFKLPQRLWDFLLSTCAIAADTKWSELPAKEQNKLMHILTTHELQVYGKTTFKEEFVTCGGIDLQEIDAHTMQSKIVPNLFFGGEILDVDGITGGFNFQHAWTSGYVAAKKIAEKSLIP